jgi:hypothetical protein
MPSWAQGDKFSDLFEVANHPDEVALVYFIDAVETTLEVEPVLPKGLPVGILLMFVYVGTLNAPVFCVLDIGVFHKYTSVFRWLAAALKMINRTGETLPRRNCFGFSR